MNKYTIFCTAEQTKKALELGAPIEHKKFQYHYRGVLCEKDELIIPTAEQMIGWLEEQGFDITASSFCVAVDYEHVGTLGIYSGSRKEATLIAIDCALEYLEKQKLK